MNACIYNVQCLLPLTCGLAYMPRGQCPEPAEVLDGKVRIVTTYVCASFNRGHPLYYKISYYREQYQLCIIVFNIKP